MTPEEYVNEIVMPTVREFFDAPGDRRKGYLAAMVTYHIRDYIMRAIVPLGADEKAKRAALKNIDCNMVVRHKVEYEIVEGVCNGTKHCGRDFGAHRFAPGDEKYVPQFAFDTPGAGFDEARWDMPGLHVEHDGSAHFVDECVRTVLRDFQSEYGQHLGIINLGF